MPPLSWSRRVAQRVRAWAQRAWPTTLRVVCAIVVAGLIGCGVWWRLDGLGERHLWLDEALSWRLARLPFAEIVARTSEATTVHPPLFFVLLHYWMQLAGDSEAALRALPCLFGIAGIPAAWLAARNLQAFLAPSGGRAGAAGCVAAIIVALSPFQAHLAQQARGYTLGVFLCLVSTAALAGLLGTGTRRTGWSVLYVAAASLACYTHHVAVLTVFAQAVFALCWSYWPADCLGELAMSDDRRRSLRRTLWWVAAALFVLVLPLAAPLLRQSEAAADAWLRPIRGSDIPEELTEAFVLTSSSPARISAAVDVASLIALGALFAGFLLVAGWPGRYAALLGSVPVWVLGVYSLIASRSLFDSRYFAFAQIMWLIGCGVLFARISNLSDRLIVASVISLLCLQLPLLQRPDTQRLQHGIRSAVAHLRQWSKPQDLVLAVTPGVFFEASYYARSGPAVGLLSETKDRLQHEAAAHLDSDDLAFIDDVAGGSPRRIWILTMPAYDRAVERCLPLGDYRLSSKSEWRQDWTWEKKVELREYNRIEKIRRLEQARHP